MSSTELREILEPAYGPCVHLSGICRHTCDWRPERGLVPRGFGGASATPDAVRLVIVTAEPGEPMDGEQYAGSPYQILSAVLSSRTEYLVEGTARRNGRPEPYTRSLRKILDLCWPALNIGEQLERTWVTNSVKCSAPGGKFSKEIERVCIATYLGNELAAFPDAFVLALGNKAASRLKSSGICVDATADHPSTRPYREPEITWLAAAQRFRDWLEGVHD
jgi:hypothetical protein